MSEVPESEGETKPEVVEKELAERLESLVDESVAIAKRAWDKNVDSVDGQYDREPIGRLADTLLSHLLEKEEQQ